MSKKSGTMIESSEIKIAYTLLPPPLAALPAKYWTSISLWLHSYSVGKMFRELVDSYTKVYEVENAPTLSEAFTIGFLHDLGQKLHLRGKPSDEKIVKYISEGLESLGCNPGEVRMFTRLLYTNPAETMATPIYERNIWTLLQLADRLHGSSNIFELVTAVKEAGEKLGHSLTTKIINVTIPQPFIRSLLTKKLQNKLLHYAEENNNIVIPISTPMGIIVLTNSKDLHIELDWDDIREGFEGDGIVPQQVEEDLVQCKDYCEKGGGEGSKPKKFTKRDCKRGINCNKNVGNSYKITLIYYGLNHKIEGAVCLSANVKEMFQGVTVRGIEFVDGDHVCPICGLRTPTAFSVDYIQYFTKNVKTEQWTRYLYPGNLNQLMQMYGKYGVDPLCLGDILVRSRYATMLLITLTINASTPLSVLDDVGHIMYVVYENRNSEWEKILEEASKPSIGGRPNYFVDAFTTTLIMPYRDQPKNPAPVDEWITDMMTAGLLISWGFYPLSISETVMKYHDKLLSYYRGMKPLFNYSPSDRNLGSYTPYVALTLLSLRELQARREEGSLPALLEVLDYPPEYSPTLLQYSSPELYSMIESLRSRIEV